MTLAQLFYARHPRRHHGRSAKQIRRQRTRVLLEPLEGRVLLSADPASLLLGLPTLVDNLDLDTQPPPAPPGPAVIDLGSGEAETPVGVSGAGLAPATSDTLPHPVPLQAVQPLGSMIYDPPATGTLDAIGEVDTFTLALDAGQKLTLAATPGDLSLAIHVELFDPLGVSLGSTTGTAGSTVVLPDVAIAVTGTYEYRLTASEGAGLYESEAILNASVESEHFVGGSNDDILSAQPIDTSSVEILPGADRLAVIGELDAAGDVGDFYSFNLTAGQAASILLARTDGNEGPIEVSLYDSASQLLTLGVADATNTDRAIRDFVASSAGTYYAQVTGDVGHYSLLVTRNATFEGETNETPTDARDIGPDGVAMGSLGFTGNNTSGSGPIRVAVHGFNGGNVVVPQLNDDTFFDFQASTVQGFQIDTMTELDQFDVVVLGDSGYEFEYGSFAAAW